MAELKALPKNNPLVRVLVADSNRMNTQLLVEALARDLALQVTEAEPAEAAILTAGEQADVLLLSSTLGESPKLGFQIAKRLTDEQSKTRVVMLLDTSDRLSVLEAFRAGVRGVFCRTESLELLGKCIHAAHAGQVWANSRELGYLLEAVSQAMPRMVDAKGLTLLSKREQEVVHCVAEGLSNREIAKRLTLTEHTVKNYLFRIFDKLGVSSRVEVVLYAFSHGHMGPAAESQKSQ
jgi:two-component system, NarL family, nitrate/nitrite response regulator NarL